MARCNNPVRYFNPATATTAVIVLGTLAALGIGAAVVARRRRRAAKPTVIPEGYLSGYFVPGATLGAAPLVMSDLQFGAQPFYLSEEKIGGPIGFRDLEGEITFHKELHFGNLDDLGALVTNIYSDMMYPLYEHSLNLISAQGYKDPKLAAMATMARYRPNIEWEMPLTPGSAEDITLKGATILAELAKQNLENKGLL